MSVLRLYLPSECDAAGVPLDWEYCRACGGSGEVIDLIGMENYGKPRSPQPGIGQMRCTVCEGHGSLKAAALFDVAWVGDRHRGDAAALPTITRGARQIVAPRCGNCGHPMSEGTWEDMDPLLEHDLTFHNYLMAKLAAGQEPGHHIGGTHYSRCDEWCRHAGPIRVDPGDGWYVPTDETPAGEHAPTASVEASWRQVDVRCLSWPRHLTADVLAVLCLRCWAVRTS